MRRMSRGKVIGMAWFLAVLLIVTAMLAAAYFLTARVYRITGIYPPPLLNQIVNSLLGLLFTGLFISAVMRVARVRGWLPERNVFAPIIRALEQIAQGDFSIRVESEFKDNPIVGELATTINKMAFELDELESLRQEFISNVSHEIQSPLTSIKGFAEALENDQLTPEERHHYLDIIKNESSRLSRITEDLLKLASLESEHAKFEPKHYRLDKQIRTLILACEPQRMEKQLNMNVSLDEVSITADEDLLSQVWSNLLHNSIKFTPACGTIGVDLHPQAGRIEIRISDTGIGIPEDDQARVFERFYKADKSRTSATGGSGLGLSIVKKIIEMHEGSIAVESEMGKGTTFTVTLPAN